MGWGMEGCVQENIVLDHEASSDHHNKMTAIDTITAYYNIIHILL